MPKKIEKDIIIIRYSEIALKGLNRPYFEKKLTENIKKTLKKIATKEKLKIKKEWGQVIIFKKSGTITENIEKKLKEKLQNVLGIENFCFAIKSSKNIKELAKKIIESLNSISFKTFKIDAKRQDKSFKLTTPEIEKLLGEKILKKFKTKKVKLRNPDLTIFVEILKDLSVIYFEKIKGFGGLPVGTSSKGVCLLSSGIDSPVAGFKMAKRGMKIEFLHFSSYPFTSYKSVENVKKIVRVLTQFNLDSNLYISNISEIQRYIISRVPARLRLIFYRRAMLKIAKLLAEKVNAKTLITGESLGQVASQTIENIKAIEYGINFPILRPNIGDNKEEIVNLAKKIKTYEISILPYEDCCSFMISKHPETKANIKEILEIEKKLNLDPLIKSSFKNLEKIKFKLIK